MRVCTSAGSKGVLAGAAALLVLSGCGSTAASTSNPPASAGPSTARAATPTSTRAATVALPPDTTPSILPETKSPAALTLSDRGVGGLELGMTRARALATGLVGRKVDSPDAGPDGCVMNAGRRGIDRVYFAHGRVRIIAVSASIRLDSGIGVADTYGELHRAYPDADVSQAPGRLYLPAPGARIAAAYRIGLDTDDAFSDSKITEIALQAADNECYE